MNKEALNRAIERLTISDVYLAQSKTESDPTFEPRREGVKLGIQFRHSPLEEFGLVEVEGSLGTGKLARFHMDTGLRIIDVSEGINLDSAAVPEDKIKAIVEAVFVAEYKVKDGELPDEEAIVEFVRVNVMYHVWPYWREFVHSTMSRMRFPTVVLPNYRVPSETREPAPAAATVPAEEGKSK